MTRWEAIRNGSILFYRFADPPWGEIPHGFLTRRGGVSAPPFASLNLSHSVGDDPAAVAENLRRAFAAAGLRPEETVTAWLVHGNRVLVVDARHGGAALEGVDGLITAERGLALFMRFADCIPVLLADPDLPAVGLVHVGWRGLAAGILESALEAFERHLGRGPSALHAALGPGIGGCCYAVGPEVIEALGPRLGPALLLRRRNGTWHLDLPEAVRLHLRRLGVPAVITAGICTACHTGLWFSHRAEHGRTGRFGVWIRNP
jgi:YfiH family protein